MAFPQKIKIGALQIPAWQIPLFAAVLGVSAWLGEFTMTAILLCIFLMIMSSPRGVHAREEAARAEMLARPEGKRYFAQNRRWQICWAAIFLVWTSYAVVLGWSHQHSPALFNFLIDSMEPLVSALKEHIPKVKKTWRILYASGYSDRTRFADHGLVMAHLIWIPLLALGVWRIKSLYSFLGWKAKFVAHSVPWLCFMFFVSVVIVGLIFWMQQFLVAGTVDGKGDRGLDKLLQIQKNDFFMVGELFLILGQTFFLWMGSVTCSIMALHKARRRNVQPVPRQ